MPEGTGDQGGEQKPEGNQPSESGKPPKTFTQEELDSVIEARLQRERSKFADYEGLKEKAKAFDEAEAAKKSELERAQAEVQKAKDESSAALARANGVLKRAAILAEAANQKAADPDTVAMLLLNAESISVNEDGEVTGAKDAVKKLLKDKPFLAGQTSSGGSSGGEFGGGEGPSLAQQIADAEAKGDYTTALSLKMRAGTTPG